ncbi:hypothetical protein ADUPG1_007795 [Aduncisulcus paluster]|uniref:Protein kinase domain-containing protein n=1 Tax=Aduncisulcus paluster TaxID=2918883 RepID=A0ABQ5KR06_9EUKA|nr:hypothetical protein ADUPG1_007795 [Aduncisulcus paluster]
MDQISESEIWISEYGEIKNFEPEFIHYGDYSCLPIPRNAPNVTHPKYSDISNNKVREMLKGAMADETFSYITLPFSPSTFIKGSYVCIKKLMDWSPIFLTFSFTSSIGLEISKQYEFPKIEKNSWFFLPIDLPDVTRCVITGKWRNMECDLEISSIVFFREETHEETLIREAREKMWSEAPIIPKFVHEGDRNSIPIPRDDPLIVNSLFKPTKRPEWCHESFEAQRLLDGEDGEIKNNIAISHLSMHLPSPYPPCHINGACICVNRHAGSSALLFTFTDCDGKKTSKKYEFTKPEHRYEWYFLPIDLMRIVSCEIEGKGTWTEKNSRALYLSSLVFIRKESSEELPLESRKKGFMKLWSKSESIRIKYFSSLDDDLVSLQVPVLFEMVRGKDNSHSKESMYYDQGLPAQNMLKGESSVRLSHLSIPFSSSCPLKGAFIRLDNDNSSPSLLFTFTLSDGTKKSKKYKFTFPSLYEKWKFLPIDVDDVVSCEIQGKGTWKERNSRIFTIDCLLFIKVATIHEYLIHFPTQRKVSRLNAYFEAGIIIPKFIHEGNEDCVPVPSDHPSILDPTFVNIKAWDMTKKKTHRTYNQSLEAQKMLKCLGNFGRFTKIIIPFPFASPIFGAYIALAKEHSYPPSLLIFSFTSSNGRKTHKKYEIPEFKSDSWYFLPIDLPDCLDCSIIGKGIGTEYFCIESLVFVREEIVEDSTRERVETPLQTSLIGYQIIIPEYMYEGDRDSLRISRDDPSIINPIYSIVRGKNISKSTKSRNYDQSSQVLKMLKGESSVTLSHLSLPFSSPNRIKGAYICVDKFESSPSLTFCFSFRNGKKAQKVFDFTEPLLGKEWHYLPIGLKDVILCEIQGIGTWKEKNSRYFKIHSLVFIQNKDSHSTSTIKGLIREKEKTQTFQSEWTDGDSSDEMGMISEKKQLMGEKEQEMEDKPKDEDSSEDEVEYLGNRKNEKTEKIHKHRHKPRQHEHVRVEILTSAESITPLCTIGHGGFGEVILAHIDGVSFPCVLKKMLCVADEKVVRGCKHEFNLQLHLFNNPKCFNRIPRPLYILDLLNEDYIGDFGFMMEFCAGGSVKDFAKSWCADGKYLRTNIESSEESESDFSYSDYDCVSYSSDCQEHFSSDFDPMTLNPVKVCALCVGMIECLDEVFKAKKTLVHRDIKPDNFLIRVDPDSKKCSVVLADLGLARIQDSIQRSSSYQLASSGGISESDKKTNHDLFCGTVAYSPYEALKYSQQTRAGDAYSLGMSILSLFLCKHPIINHPLLHGVKEGIIIVKKVAQIIEEGLYCSLSRTPLFKSLLDIEGGKFKHLHKCLDEVFIGLTLFDPNKRINVHKACEKVQAIKHFLPEIGEGFEYPILEDFKKEKIKKYGKPKNIVKQKDSEIDRHHKSQKIDSLRIMKRSDDASMKQSTEKEEDHLRSRSSVLTTVSHSMSELRSLSVSSSIQSSILPRSELEDHIE